MNTIQHCYTMWLHKPYTHTVFHGVLYKQTFLTLVSCQLAYIHAPAHTYSFINLVLIHTIPVCMSTNLHKHLSALCEHIQPCRADPSAPEMGHVHLCSAGAICNESFPICNKLQPLRRAILGRIQRTLSSL